MLLYEKLIRLSHGQYWYKYENKERNPKTQHGFVKKVHKLKEQYSIISNEPQPMIQNPTEIESHDCFTDLNQSVFKKGTDTMNLKLLALETINSKYPEPEWLRTYTDAWSRDIQLHVHFL